MKRMQTTSCGYILILTISVIALAVVIMTYISFRATAYGPFAKATVERQKAAMLAQSGLQIALGQLAQVSEQKEQESNKTPLANMQESAGDAKDALTLLKTLLPVKNQWQTFTLQKTRDGVNGTIQICIVCEEGKIDINQIFDFENAKFVGDENFKKALQVLFERMQTFVGGQNLFSAFEKFLKERQYKLHDVTELLMIKEFEVFKRRVFYEPPEQKPDQVAKEKRPLYLTDIFTVWSGRKKIEPWLLSDSLCGLLDLRRAGSEPLKQEQINELLKKFKLTATWSTDWNTLLAPLYGKKFDTLPKGIESVLSTTFEPTTFSVLSYGKIGKITQKLLAIIERSASSEQGKTHVDVTIKKLYWL